MIELRDYQLSAVNAAWDYIANKPGNPCIVIPTGGGKTPVIAQICCDVVEWKGRALVLAHVKELIQQTVNELVEMAPHISIGTYSAGLKKKDKYQSVIVAGIQSIYDKLHEFESFNIIVIDEAHMIPPDGEGMYQQLIKTAKLINPQIRIIGLTATPYRMKNGPVCTTSGILNEICYEVSIKELIEREYICPLVSFSPFSIDESNLGTVAGEFISSDVSEEMTKENIIKSSCAYIAEATKNREATLIFCASINHGNAVMQELDRTHSIECGWVDGTTGSKDRESVLNMFRNRWIKYLANVNVLTTGFNARHVDCVVLLRPTLSPGLYYQMVGRGFRTSSGKTDCLVLDFGGNINRHGPVDCIQITPCRPSIAMSASSPGKNCPECRNLIHIQEKICPWCGHDFSRLTSVNHDGTPSSQDIISNSDSGLVKKPVVRVTYNEHVKYAASVDAPRTLRVKYWHDLVHSTSEWVCVEHPSGYAQKKAESWWRKRSLVAMPFQAANAAMLGNAGLLANCTEITTKINEKTNFEEIKSHVLGEIPNATEESLQNSFPGLDFRLLSSTTMEANSNDTNDQQNDQPKIGELFSDVNGYVDCETCDTYKSDAAPIVYTDDDIPF